MERELDQLFCRWMGFILETVLELIADTAAVHVANLFTVFAESNQDKLKIKSWSLSEHQAVAVGSFCSSLIREITSLREALLPLGGNRVEIVATPIGSWLDSVDAGNQL